MEAFETRVKDHIDTDRSNHDDHPTLESLLIYLLT